MIATHVACRDVARPGGFGNLTGTTTSAAAGGAAPFDDSGPTGRFGPIAVGAAFVLALATFLVFAGFTPILPTATVVSILLIGDGLVVITLIVLIGIELARLRAARKAARAGARLHSRFVALFSLVAAIPAIVTAVVATVSVEWAINPRFMSDVAAFINEANQATQLYRESQCRALLRDVDLTAGDIARSALLLRSEPDAVQGSIFSSRSKTLGFAAAALMKGDGTSGGDRRRLEREADRETRPVRLPGRGQRRGSLRLSRGRQHLCRHSADPRGRGRIPLRGAGHRSAGGQGRPRRRDGFQYVGTLRGRTGTVSNSALRPFL